ncbi:MAG TPA: hypothetical protein VK009_19600 [Chloroflexota bacterium]|nr:hypothetical protein [Chloroflexota bacterium]
MLVTVVVELFPVAEALPLLAWAVLLVELLTLWLVVELVLPVEPEPLPPPPAALVVPLEALVLLLPLCPVALAEPDFDVADPELVTVVVLDEDVLLLLVPPLVEPPVAVLPPLLPFETVVWDVLPVELALPLEPLALDELEELDDEELVDVVAAMACPVASMAMTAPAVPARASTRPFRPGPFWPVRGREVGVFLLCTWSSP